MADATNAVTHYSQEKKLEVLKYYYENGRNKYRTAQKFGIDKKCLHRWITDEAKEPSNLVVVRQRSGPTSKKSCSQNSRSFEAKA